MSNHRFLLSGLIYFSSFVYLFAIEAPAVATVRSVGTSDTRDGALVDACRLAIAQIHGGRITGALTKTNQKDDAAGKSINSSTIVAGGDVVIGNTEGRYVDTKDSSSLSFDGLLVRYKLTSQTPPANDNKQWSIAIEADVLKSLPDRFAGRIAVVIPSQSQFLKKVGDADIAKFLRNSMQSWFVNSPQFVLLERDDESAIDEEIQRARGSASSIAEKSKLSSEKVADIFIGLEDGELRFNERSTSFKLTSKQSHTCEASINIVFKAIDVATKGEITRIPLTANAKKSSTNAASSREQAVTDLKNEIERLSVTAGLELVNKIK